MFSILLPAPLIGAVTFLVMLALLIVIFLFLLPGIVLKLIPYVPLQRACSRYCVGVAIQWAAGMQLIYRILHPKQWRVDVRGKLDPKRSYLLVSNHQSMADILVLFDVLHGRVPLPRFFLKQQLMYVPIIGMGCWAMDFPFMKRHSKEAVAANPALRNQDLETTRRSCEIFRTEPVTLVNFIEGTRFSERKRVKSQSPYRYLLRPKSGGVSFALNAMGDQFAGLIDISIVYRQTRKPLFWSWLCGEQDDLALHANISEIPADLVHGDYENDAEFRARFQTWINELWARKDARLGRMLDQPLSPPIRPAHHF